MCWFPFIFVEYKEILDYLECLHPLPLRAQHLRAIAAFARKHYERMDFLTVHKLTDRNVGGATLVSNNLRQIQMSFDVF